MDELISLIKQAFAWLKRIALRVINGIMRFHAHIVNWFKSLNLIKGKHVPFIADADSPDFKKMLANARKVNVGIYEKDTHILNGVFDIETDEIIHCELLGADMVDEQTKNTLNGDSLVVLS